MSSKLIALMDETIAFIAQPNNTEQKSDDVEPDEYNQDIVNQLLELEIGTKQQILNAMDKVQNKNDIQEIAEYLMSINIDTQHIVNNNIQPNHQNDKINTLISMGYKMNSVKKALEISNNDTQIAAQYLIDGVININTYNYQTKNNKSTNATYKNQN
eukprot:881148_1